MDPKIKNFQTIFFSGGGTGGSVTPLLALAEELLKSGLGAYRLIFIGTAKGPEQEMVADFNEEIRLAKSGPAHLEFLAISSGKWRRYFSWHNFLDCFKIVAAFWQSLRLLSLEKADLVVSAGSFASVPLVWAAAWKKIPVIIHQQDVRPGFANKLMAPFALVISVVFEKSLLDYGSRAIFIGNPLRPLGLPSGENFRREVKDTYHLQDNLPLILVTGGRLGAQALNNLIYESSRLLDNYQIVHLVGEGKSSGPAVTPLVDEPSRPNYQILESLANQEILKLMAAADLVISRCGLGTLTELSALSKAAILIPLPDSHQEDNAAVFKAASAALVLNQKKLTPAKLAEEIRRIILDKKLRASLENNIARIIKKGATEKLLVIIEEILSRPK